MPLKQGSYEAEQFWYFYEHGLQVSVRSDGGTLGGTFEQTGPGGNFLSSEHTTIHFADNLYQSPVWSNQMYKGWMHNGVKKDVDFAKEIYLDILNDLKSPEIFLDEETENKLLAVIRMPV